MTCNLISIQLLYLFSITAFSTTRFISKRNPRCRFFQDPVKLTGPTLHRNPNFLRGANFRCNLSDDARALIEQRSPRSAGNYHRVIFNLARERERANYFFTGSRGYRRVTNCEIDDAEKCTTKWAKNARRPR